MTVPARRARRQEDEMPMDGNEHEDRRLAHAALVAQMTGATRADMPGATDRLRERIAELEREVGRLRYREDQRIRDRDEALEEARIRRDQEDAIIARAEQAEAHVKLLEDSLTEVRRIADQAERERDAALARPEPEAVQVCPICDIAGCRHLRDTPGPGADDETRARALVNATPDLAARRVADAIDEARREGEARGRAWGGNTSRCCVSDCTRYADYCEAHAREACREGAQAERKACAAEAEREPFRSSGEIAAAIRARESVS